MHLLVYISKRKEISGDSRTERERRAFGNMFDQD